MCGRYGNSATASQLTERFGVQIPEELVRASWNIKPSQDVLSLTADGHGRQARLQRWGLIPPWASDLRVGNRFINATVEKLRDKGRYAGVPLDSAHRVLIPATNYYEWRADPEWKAGPGSPKRPASQPFTFELIDETSGRPVPFAFAGLQATNRRIGPEPIHSVTLITCDAAPNRIASWVHDRMPVVLAEKTAQHTWLDDVPRDVANAVR